MVIWVQVAKNSGHFDTFCSCRSFLLLSVHKNHKTGHQNHKREQGTKLEGQLSPFGSHSGRVFVQWQVVLLRQLTTVTTQNTI